jgi:hypothetical protein
MGGWVEGERDNCSTLLILRQRDPPAHWNDHAERLQHRQKVAGKPQTLLGIISGSSCLAIPVPAET